MSLSALSNRELPPGPNAYRNWHASLQGLPALSGYEITIYSDARIIGSVTSECGPYTIHNSLPVETEYINYKGPRIPRMLPRIVIRGWDHVPLEWGFSSFHFDVDGHTINDELTSLLSLDMGVRLRHNGISRSFRSPEDKYGEPIPNDPELIVHGVPTLRLYPILPDLTKGELNSKRIGKYYELRAEQATALVRAALSYQNAIWVADTDQNLAWLRLVAAIEAASNHWFKGVTKLDSVSAFREIKPSWSKEILEKHGPDVERFLAKKLENLVGSTYKFVKFIKAFAPPPPAERPIPSLRFDFEYELLNAMKTVYDYRSRALHSGIGFPIGMCDIPFIMNDDKLEVPPLVPKERLNEAPLLLRTFEYIVRRVLQSWWDSMLIKAA